MSKQIKAYYPLLLMLIILSAGCLRTPTSDVQPTPGSIATASIPTFPKATPYASEPAAGICSEAEGEIVEVSVNPDVPNPRCVIVKPEQKLRVRNNTQDTIEVTLGTFTISLEPGMAGVMDQPLGEFLEPGVHLIMTSSCCGGEVWLKPN